MEHAPIYRSTTRRTNTSFFPWQRTASLASAAAALTMSGIALGYHGFTTTTITTPRTGATSGTATPLDMTASGRNVAAAAAAPVPTVSLAIADGGHPDVISALSSALIARFQIPLPPVLVLPFGPPAQVLPAPVPRATAEPFVLPPIEIQPSADPTELPLDVAAVPPTEDVVAADPITEPVVAAAPAAFRALIPIPMSAPEDVMTSADAPQVDAPPDPLEQVVAVAQAEPAPAPAEPAPAPAQAAPAAPIPAPALVATPVPVVHKPTPVPAKPAPVPEDEAPQVQVKHTPPPAASHANGNANANANADNGNNQDHNPPAHGTKNDKGKGGGSDHGG